MYVYGCQKSLYSQVRGHTCELSVGKLVKDSVGVTPLTSDSLKTRGILNVHTVSAFA